MPVDAVAPAIVWLASDECSETNNIYNVTAGAIQRIAIVMGPGFYRSTAHPGEHRRELRKGPSDRRLLRTRPVRGRYVDLSDACNRLTPWTCNKRGGVMPGRLTPSTSGVLTFANIDPEERPRLWRPEP